MKPDQDNQPPAQDVSPYAPPTSAPRTPDQRISDNPSVFDEPWMRANSQRFEADERDSVDGLQMATGQGDPENSVCGTNLVCLASWPVRHLKTRLPG